MNVNAAQAIQRQIKKEHVTPTKESLLKSIRESKYTTISKLLKYGNSNNELVMLHIADLESQGEIIVFDDKIIAISPRITLSLIGLIFFGTVIFGNLIA
ncbi:hypothetical protein [Bacillus subtilis]|uniref:hypothetical protein n=1 Tax=Bacillus subtilis TaxID=1423 RepID=UPI002DB6785D|nr:hypothetical protein [Bacillus subtilis]MEC0285533.1 hypothetical protein [Bacillus subtilis]MEC0481496.1 hypothetical protein [Bacillus subtilis]MEC0522214.1 hypothetical protein [Bacillus subtilis]